MLRRRIEDREIEYLLTRQARDDSDGLASVLATLSLERLAISVDDRAADFAATASRLVQLSEPAVSIRPVRSRVVPRLVTAALSAVLIVGLAGVADAADAAAPGDPLYGLDRALEQVGINAGGLDERLDEAQALADDGNSAEALAHLAETLDTTSPNAADALEAAAERFGAHDNPSQAVLEDVAAMLDWMANTQESGRDFGHGVAERAREIGAGHANTPAAKPDTPTSDSNAGNADLPVDDDGDTNANADDGKSNSGSGSSGSSGYGGNSDGSNTGGEGGKGGGNGPPGGSPPGQRAP
jgi:uncharacterized membrane protein YgcG